MHKKANLLIWLCFLALATIIVVFLCYNLWGSVGYGVVNGVLYNVENNSSAIIEGEIVKEGDVIHEVRVIKIYKAQVEFEKDGKVWKQQVGEYPNSAW